ncbi:hypothetical protein DPMN_173192 [Dreissena polymorpha]|uniref:Uncharacterized protein n=1 Tax=Dreissena polymorpha TaxID=45954 RepID=A0A9D4E2E4_DREPO|nr:hypothetical protein DPMN_173192 [Dreissena polymorpha]
MARQRPTWLVMGLCIVEIERIVIREVRYQLDVNLKGNFGWVWPMWAGCPRINLNVIREVQYQFEVNRCRNEEIIVKGNFGWAWSILAWPMWAGHPKIIRIAIREIQYQFEDIRCSTTCMFQGSKSGQDGRRR